jgi:uncharacterized membrane protein YedE/YeeE
VDAVWNYYDQWLDDPRQQVLWAGALLGLCFGVLAQSSGFCLLRGMVEAVQRRRGQKLRLFIMALLVAILGTQGLQAQMGIDLSASLYVQSQPAWPLLVLGGLLFGYGMALANACGARSLVLLGSGHLRALVTLGCLALAAGMTLAGILAPLRLSLENLTRSSLSVTTLPEGLAAITGLSLSLSLGVLLTSLTAVLLWWLWRCPAWRATPSQWLVGAAIGALIPAGWWITGVLGADDFDPVRLASLTFVAPVVDTQQYMQLATGMRLDFGIVVIMGVFGGALLSALWRRDFHWQGFDSLAQLQRSIGGGLLMGIGGVLALGCSIGQGLSGLSTLAPGSLVVLFSILAGIWLRLQLSAVMTDPTPTVSA